MFFSSPSGRPSPSVSTRVGSLVTCRVIVSPLASLMVTTQPRCSSLSVRPSPSVSRSVHGEVHAPTHDPDVHGGVRVQSLSDAQTPVPSMLGSPLVHDCGGQTGGVPGNVAEEGSSRTPAM